MNFGQVIRQRFGVEGRVHCFSSFQASEISEISEA